MDNLRVTLRCRVSKGPRTCGRYLSWISTDDAPQHPDDPQWDGMLHVPTCPVHGGAHGSVTSYVGRKGLPEGGPVRVPSRRWIRWRELQAAVDKARATYRNSTAGI